MYQIVQEYPLLSVVATGTGTLLVSWLWNNIVRPAARLTKYDCQRNQNLCQATVEAKILADSKRIKRIEHYLSVTLFAQMKLCTAMKIDCSDIVAKMASLGLVEGDDDGE